MNSKASLMRFLLRRAALLAGFSVAAGEAAAQPEPTAPAPAVPATPPPVVVPPKLKSEAAVPYPEGESTDAAVTLLLVIDPTGKVTSATAEQALPPFSDLAVQAGARMGIRTGHP